MITVADIQKTIKDLPADTPVFICSEDGYSGLQPDKIVFIEPKCVEEGLCAPFAGSCVLIRQTNVFVEHNGKLANLKETHSQAVAMLKQWREDERIARVIYNFTMRNRKGS